MVAARGGQREGGKRRNLARWVFMCSEMRMVWSTIEGSDFGDMGAVGRSGVTKCRILAVMAEVRLARCAAEGGDRRAVRRRIEVLERQALIAGCDAVSMSDQTSGKKERE